MKKINSGDGATALNVDISAVDPRLTPGPHPEQPWDHHQPQKVGGGFLGTDPVSARRMDDLERRVKALEDRE
jgi:hypothetical protein